MGWLHGQLAFLALGPLLLACADPTAIDVTVLSEVPCTAQAEVALSVAGDPQALAGAGPAAVATRCEDVGDGTVRRGSVVIVPLGDKVKQVAFQLTTRNDGKPVETCASDPSGCIAARRELRFQSRKITEVTVDLRLSCLGVLCSLDETCVKGACVSALLPPCDFCGEPDAGGEPPTGVTAVAPPATVTTLAGSGSAAYADGTGTAANFANPYGVAVDSAGNVYVADGNNHRIRKVSGVGVVTTLAGSGMQAFADGTGVAASFTYPIGMTVDGAGNVYVGDSSGNRIRRVTAAGVVTTLAGSGMQASVDGTGAGASFTDPYGVAVDGAGNVYVADTGNARIRMVTSAGVVTTLAGSGTGYADGIGSAASFYSPQGIAVDGAANVYVADTFNHRIRKVTSAGAVTTLAGSGAKASDDGVGVSASFNGPRGVAVDGAGNIYVADTGNSLIRRVTSAGSVTTLAGSGSATFADGAGASASFAMPFGITLDSAGNLYVGDSDNQRIRKITLASGQLLARWLPPGNGAPVTGYTASASASLQPTRSCTTVMTACTIGGLMSGVAYSVTVRATTAVGQSPAFAPSGWHAKLTRA